MLSWRVIPIGSAIFLIALGLTQSWLIELGRLADDYQDHTVSLVGFSMTSTATTGSMTVSNFLTGEETAFARISEYPKAQS